MGDEPVAGARICARAATRIRGVSRAALSIIGSAAAPAAGIGECRGIAAGDGVPVAALGSCAPRRLHSALVNVDDGAVSTIAFYAAVASTEAELAARLRGAHGSAAEIDARRGFDPGHPLLSAPVVKLLSDAATRPEADWVTVCVRVDFPSRRETCEGELPC